LFDSLRISHSKLSSNKLALFDEMSFKEIGMRYYFASVGMSIDEKFNRRDAYFFKRVL
jgi:hypothetical protein